MINICIPIFGFVYVLIRKLRKELGPELKNHTQAIQLHDIDF